MKADRLLAHNIRWLLKTTGVEQRELAKTLRHSEAWLSKGLNGTRANQRGFRITDLDGIAQFFGLRVAQLFSEAPPTASLRRRAPGRRPGRRPRA